MDNLDNHQEEKPKKFSFKDAFRRLVPEKKRQVDIYAPEIAQPSVPHKEYLDTLHDTGDTYIDFSMKGCTELIDWDLKIDEELKNGRNTIDEVFPMILLAEATGQISEDKIGKTIQTLVQKETSRWESAAASSEARYKESNRQFDEYNAKAQGNTAEAYTITLKHMTDNKNGAYEWYSKQRDKTIDAKNEMYKQAASINTQIQTMFGNHREKESWKSLDNRVLVVTKPEYLQINTGFYGKEKAKQRSEYTGGFTTLGNIDTPGTVVVPFNTRFDMTNQQDPSTGISLFVSSGSDNETLTHELLHLSPLDKKDLSVNSAQKFDKGFMTSYFDTDGRPTALESAEQNSTPMRAMEEGSVVFFQKLIRAGNAESASLMLNDFSETVGLSGNYVEAAKITAEIAMKVGVDTVLNAYTNSSRELLLQSIESKLGVDEKEAYVQKMRQLDERMNNDRL